eukprot:8192107-Alexandrium_andersonii.AAC.1
MSVGCPKGRRAFHCVFALPVDAICYSCSYHLVFLHVFQRGFAVILRAASDGNDEMSRRARRKRFTR